MNKILLTKEERIALRDELFEEFKDLSIIYFQKTYYKFNKNAILLNSFKNNIELKEKYNLYIQQFRTEEEALYCIIHKDDISNHLCSICNELCKFYNKKRGYRDTCGNKNCKQKALENTNIKVRGVPYPMKDEEVKNKQQEKMLNEYGARHALQIKEFKEKAENTTYNNFGVKNPFESKIIQERIKNIIYNNLGVPLQNDEIEERRKQTCKDIFGVPYPTQCEKVKEKIRSSRIKNNLPKNNLSNKEFIKFLNKFNKLYHLNIQIDEIYSKNEYFIKFIKHLYKNRRRLLRLKEIADIFRFAPNTIGHRVKELKLLKFFYIVDSNLELQFKELLENNNIDFERANRNILPKTENNGQPELDFYLKDYNIAFEINDMTGHNFKRKNKEYHINKVLKSKQKGIRLIHLWEWELTDEDLWNKTSNWILNLLNNQKVNIDIKDCTIKEVDKEVAQHFINEYNLYDYEESDVNFGLFYNNQPLQVMTFKRQNDNNFELLQFCTKYGFKVKFGAKELINYFIQSYNLFSIIAIVNLDKFSGATFEEIKFKLIKYNEPKLVSYNNKSNSLYKSIYNCGQNIYQLKLN